MKSTNNEAAPVSLGAPTPSGSGCEPTRHQKGKFMTIVNHTLDTTTNLRLEVQRRPLPPVPQPDGTNVIDRWDTYAIARCGDISGHIERFCYWDPSDDQPIDVIVEARIFGMPDHAGMSDAYAADPAQLLQLSALTAQLAVLFMEAHR